MLGRRERWIVAAMLVLAFVIRMAWLVLGPASRLEPHRSEMWRVAATFARTGQLADAYAPGSGVSSHVGPFNTIIEGLVYRGFGIGSLTSEMILAVLAGGVVCTLFYLLYRLAIELGIPLVARLGALAAVCFIPFNYFVEVVDFRIREGAVAAMILAGLVWWALTLDRKGPLTLRQVALFGLAAGFAFLINPGVALGVYAVLGLVALRNLPFRYWVPAAAILLVGLLAVNGAWIVRNEMVYHRFMLSRGNFGLELAVANHPAAVNAKDPRDVFNARMDEIHPAFSPQALARLKSYPQDVDYFTALGDETKAWIASHPGDFAKLTVRHLRDLYYPPAWLWDLYKTGEHGRVPKQAYVWLITTLALGDLALALFRRSRAHLLLIAAVAMPTLLYVIVQPTLRYRYLFEGILVFLAADLAWRLAAPIVMRLLGPRAALLEPKADGQAA